MRPTCRDDDETGSRLDRPADRAQRHRRARLRLATAMTAFLGLALMGSACSSSPKSPGVAAGRLQPRLRRPPRAAHSRPAPWPR